MKALLLFLVIASYSLTQADESVNLERGICTVGYFQCKNDTLCVKQGKICDGISNCPNNSDEINCADQHDDSYYDHMFRKNPVAVHDDWNGKNCSLSYHGPCKCRKNDLLCRYLKYQRSPDDLPEGNISILDFTGNNFQTLSKEAIKTIPNNVNTLILVHCNISEIHDGTFQHLTNLNVIHLDNNKLTYLPQDIFAENATLRVLTLMYNDIVDIHPGAFNNVMDLFELDLRGNRIIKLNSAILIPLKHLSNLFLPNNNIRRIKSSNFPEIPVTVLSLAENHIQTLEKGAFSNLFQLKSLFLSNNKLSLLRDGVFVNLTELESLTLNDNVISNIEQFVFQDTPNLESLNLERNIIRSIDSKVLQPLTSLKTIYFDRFEMCSSAQHVRNCYPKGDGISDREHMLANPILRTCVWIMGAIGCTGNIIVLLGRHFAPSNNIVHSLYLRNLALSDLLMGIYLLIIAAEDQYYRGVYLTYQYKWRHSYVCKLCGFLSTLSCESSVLILSLVTWDRFISVTQPLARKQPSKKTAAATLLFLWFIATIVALLPITHFARDYFGDEFYGNNGVCLSLHIHEPYAMGWQYSAIMFILLNAVALFFISYAYLRMINEIRASGVACRSTRQNQERDKVAQRFGIIVLTDCLCWVPVILVKLVALSGKSIHQDLYAWLAIFVLPINSALNPVLYTLTTTIFEKQMRKVFSSCYRKKFDHHHTASDSGFSLSLGFPIGSTKRIINYRGTHSSSLTTSKNSWRRSTAV